MFRERILLLHIQKKVKPDFNKVFKYTTYVILLYIIKGQLSIVKHFYDICIKINDNKIQEKIK